MLVFTGGRLSKLGQGEVFYLAPGHETYNDHYQPEVRRIFVNAVQGAEPKV